MARKNTNNNETETKVTSDKYEIAWPPELAAIQPIMVIDVSATRQALVYADKKLHIPQHAPPFSTDGYSVQFVLKKTGQPPKTDEGERYYRHHDVKFYDCLLDVKLAIQEYSMMCQPKKKTVTQKVTVEVNGDDEE